MPAEQKVGELDPAGTAVLLWVWQAQDGSTAPSPSPSEDKSFSRQESPQGTSHTDRPSGTLPSLLLCFPSSGGAGGLRVPSGTSTTPSPAPPSPVSLLPQRSASNAGDCHPAGFPTCSFLQGNLGLSLALTLSSSWIRWGDGAGHASVLPRNAHEEKQKFAARVIVKGSGTHPLFVFSSSPFFHGSFRSPMNAVVS